MLTKDELERLANRGEEIYNSRLRHDLELTNRGRFVAIDVIHGTHALGDSTRDAIHALSRHNDSFVHVIRIGSRFVGRLGSAKSFGE